MEQSFMELIELLKNIAPEVWAIGRRQASVAIVTDILFLVLVIAFCVLMAKRLPGWVTKAQYDEDDHEDTYQMYCLVSLLGSIVSLVIVLFAVPELIQAVMNPDWYAIEQIMSLLPKPD